MKKEHTGYLWIAAYFMLPLSFGNWPYVFYQALRWVVTGTAITMFPGANAWWKPALLIVAILFNPFAPFHFDRGTWAMIDLIAFLIVCGGGASQKRYQNH